MARKYIIRELGDILEFMDGEVYQILNTIAFSAGLERTVYLEYVLEYECLNESIKKQFLPSMTEFKVNEIWNTTEINYTDRIKHDAYVYYCKLGFQYESSVDPDMHIRRFLEKGSVEIEDCERLWQVISKLYYTVYVRIASFSEFIPWNIDELIAEIHSNYKVGQAWYR